MLTDLYCVNSGVASKVLWYGLTLLDHALLSAGLSPQESTSSISVEQQKQLLHAIQSAEAMLDRFYSEPPKGYIWQVRQGMAAHFSRRWSGSLLHGFSARQRLQKASCRAWANCTSHTSVAKRGKANKCRHEKVLEIIKVTAHNILGC